MIRFSYRGTTAAVVILTVNEMAHFHRINEIGTNDHFLLFFNDLNLKN
jgi:hypothetical protein